MSAPYSAVISTSPESRSMLLGMTPTPEAARPEATTPQRPAVVHVFVLLALTLFLAFAGSCFIGIFVGIDAAREQGLKLDFEQLMSSPAIMIGALFFTQLATALVLWKLVPLFERLTPGSLAARLGWDEERFRWADVLLLTLGILAAGTLAMRLIRATLGLDTGTIKNINTATANASAVQFALMLLFGVVGAAITEELLFRGFVQRRFVERWGPFVGVMGASLLFGLWHFDVRQSLFAAAVGAWLGFGAQRIGSVTAGMMAHLINNGLSFLQARGLIGSDAEQHPLAPVVSFIVLAVCTWLLLRPRHEKRPA